MPKPSHGDLFRQPGADATLSYLWSRLQAHDLSQPEALAMLSALHRALGSSEVDTPGIYSSYSRFMESLRRLMPTVHDYVVAEWTESRYARGHLRPLRRSVDTLDEEPLETLPDFFRGFPRQPMKPIVPAETVEAGGEEGGEPEDAPEEGEESDGSVKDGEDERDTDGSDELDPEEDEPEEPTEGEEESSEQEGREDGPAEASPEEEETADAQPESEEGDEAGESEADAQGEAELDEAGGEEPEQPDTDQPEGIESSRESGGGGEAEEGEWPELEEPEPEEPLDGEEGGAAE